MNPAGLARDSAREEEEEEGGVTFWRPWSKSMTAIDAVTIPIRKMVEGTRHRALYCRSRSHERYVFKAGRNWMVREREG